MRARTEKQGYPIGQQFEIARAELVDGGAMDAGIVVHRRTATGGRPGRARFV